MVVAEKVTWKGASGNGYEYSIFDLNTDWNDVPGNYIFAKKIVGGWSAVYIGQTGSLKDRLPNHEALPCVRSNGGTHVHAHTNANGQAARMTEEADLLANGGATCNG